MAGLAVSKTLVPTGPALFTLDQSKMDASSVLIMVRVLK